MPWLGTKTRMSVVAGDLELDAGAMEGSYLIQEGVNDYVDTEAVGRYRINWQFEAEEGIASVGDDTNEIKIFTEISLNSLDPATPGDWSAFVPYLPGEYDCKYYRLRATVEVSPAYENRPKFLRFEHSHTPVGSVPHAASIDDSVTEPTGSEELGTRYLVLSPATGDFTGKEKQLAELVETTDRTWEFHIPIDGQEVYDKATRWKLKYEGDFLTGQWVERDYYRNQNASDGLSTTSSNTFIQKLTMTTALLLTGAIYRIGYQFEVGVATAPARAEYRVQIDDLTTIANPWFSTSGTLVSSMFDLMSGFDYYTGAGSTILIDIDFRRASPGPGDVAKIRRARLEIQRVG